MYTMEGNAPSTLPLLIMQALASQALRHAMLDAALFKSVLSLVAFYATSNRSLSGSLARTSNKLISTSNHGSSADARQKLGCLPASRCLRRSSGQFTFAMPRRYASSSRNQCHELERPVNIHAYLFADQTP
jgi:hypothetical protein